MLDIIFFMLSFNVPFHTVTCFHRLTTFITFPSTSYLCQSRALFPCVFSRCTLHKFYNKIEILIFPCSKRPDCWFAMCEGVTPITLEIFWMYFNQDYMKAKHTHNHKCTNTHTITNAQTNTHRTNLNDINIIIGFISCVQSFTLIFNL